MQSFPGDDLPVEDLMTFPPAFRSSRFASEPSEGVRSLQHQPKKLPKIDFLRALSAALVILYHAGVPGTSASFGVLTFFVISGFLITWLMLGEKEATGTVSLKQFYFRRSLRIFPAFYVYAALAITDMVLRHRVVWSSVACSLLYVGNYYQGLHNYPYSLLGHTWSLGVEEQFYLLWPAAFLLLSARMRRGVVALALLIPCIWMYRDLLVLSGVRDSYIYTALETRIDAILVGALMAMLWTHWGQARMMRWIVRPGLLPCTVALLMVSQAFEFRWSTPYRDFVGFALNPILLAVLIVQLIEWKGGRWMDSAPFRYLGRISYSTYLYQEIVLPAVGHLHLPTPAFAIVSCCSVWAIASLSYQFVEKPFLKLKRHHEPVRVESGPPIPTVAAA